MVNKITGNKIQFEYDKRRPGDAEKLVSNVDKLYESIKWKPNFDNLDFDKWIEPIKVSKYVITPECGILHITSLCQNHLTVIYDADYFPEMMMHEYAPWKKKYNKLVFNDKKLNQKIVSFLQ